MTTPHTTVPAHLGIIPDGNRRWAKAAGLPAFEGHRRGIEVIKTIARAAVEVGIATLTIYAFSAENWRRGQDEVKYLMDIFLRLATHDINELHEDGIRLRIIGRRHELSPKLASALADAEVLTKNNTRGTLVLALNYGGEQELADAAAAITREGISPDQVTPEILAAHLYEPDIPPVDLIIRTSGEHRTSGFMLARSAYSEYWFIDKHWPDFTNVDLEAALADFASRKRRFGA